MKLEGVVWDADQREIPGCGIAEKGQTVYLPPELAKSFVDQGLAVNPKPEKEKAK